MAGDWMKIELELPDKPEVHSIASTLNIDPDAVVGKLIRIWQWFDKHTTDGNAFGVTYSLPDRISGVTGFAEAMVFVGWLEQNDKTLTMPKFDRHTSNSAKTRAQTQKRVAKSRNAETVTEPLPEKRREEKIKEKSNARGTRLQAGFELSSEWGNAALEIREDWVNEDVVSEFESFCDYWISAPGQKGVKADWIATWRNWCRRSNRKGSK